MRTRNLILFGILSVIGAAAILTYLSYHPSNGVVDEYEIVFEDSVAGLIVGSPVQFNGINVGEIRQLWIDPDSPAIVIARIVVDTGAPIKEDTIVTLEQGDECGPALIQFIGGTKETPLVKDTSPSDIPRLIARRQRGELQ